MLKLRPFYVMLQFLHFLQDKELAIYSNLDYKNLMILVQFFPKLKLAHLEQMIGEEKLKIQVNVIMFNI